MAKYQVVDPGFLHNNGPRLTQYYRPGDPIEWPDDALPYGPFAPLDAAARAAWARRIERDEQRNAERRAQGLPPLAIVQPPEPIEDVPRKVEVGSDFAEPSTLRESAQQHARTQGR